MGRWTQYDEDDYRLPEGMQRIGYDADTGRYFFRDRDGSVWQGAEGAEFGAMTKVENAPSSVVDIIEDDDGDVDVDRGHDLEASSRRNGHYRLLSNDPNRPMARSFGVNTGSYRTLFPFFLIIAVLLLLVWRLVVQPNLSAPTKKCPEGTSPYWIQAGDTCWEVSRKHGWTMDKFREGNPNVKCDPLMPGTSVCLPPETAASKWQTKPKPKQIRR